jgi:hypothetical protein
MEKKLKRRQGLKAKQEEREEIKRRRPREESPS